MNEEMESGLADRILMVCLSNQRRSPRFAYGARLAIRSSQNRGRVIPGQIIDLSADGIRAEIAAELPMEEAVEVEFGLRNTSAVMRLEAAIRWRKGRQYGLEFIHTTASGREKLKQAFAALNIPL
jgi:hypothetical protein